MQELFSWLGRLESLTQDAPAGIAERMHRVLAPSVFDFEGAIVRVLDARQEANAFGGLPGRLSVLCWPDVPKEPSLSDQAVAAQLGAVFTLATNRRIQVAASDMPLTPEGSTMRTFLPTALVLDRSLAGPLGPDPKGKIDSMLSQLYGLDDDDRDAIGAAIELHYAATLLYDIEANAAYALVIAGLERLSRAYGGAPVKWPHWEQAPRLDRAFSELKLTTEQIDRLRGELLQDRHLRLRQTFASYVVDSLPDVYWQTELEDFVPGLSVQPDGSMRFEQWQAQTTNPVSLFVPSDRALLRKRLLRSYDARSSYVHEGARRAALIATASQTVGHEGTAKAPLEFVGVRTMLRALIMQEAATRTRPARLPKIAMTHSAHPNPYPPS
jgi:hypothetical protein